MKIGVSLILLLLSVSMTCCQKKLSSREYEEDLDFLLNKLETLHPFPFEATSRTKFLGEADKLKSSLPDMEEDEIALKIMALLASIKDGHTELVPDGSYGLNRWFPVRFYRFSDGIYITSIDKKYGHLAGKKVLKIGGNDPLLVHEETAGYRAFENHQGMLEEVFLMSNANVLKALGFIANLSSMEIEIQLEGDKKEIAVLKSAFSEFDTEWRFWGEMFGPQFNRKEGIKYVTAFDGKGPRDFLNEHDILEKEDLGLPLHLRSRIAWWSKYLEDSKTFYFQWNSTQDRKNESFKDFCAKLFLEADTLDIEKFVIDIRYNGGGNGLQAIPFINEVIKREYLYKDKDLFLITGRKTFSAPISHLITQLFEHLNPVLVGEPPSAGLNHCGNPVTYELPNTEYKVHISSEFHKGSYWGDTSKTIAINVPIVFSSEDYFSGNDPAMEYIETVDQYKTVLEIIEMNGVKFGRTMYDSLKIAYGEIDWWTPFRESEMNRLGYVKLRSGQLEDAIQIFELNVSEYPESPNTWDSLGEAYMKGGNKKKAIECFSNALKINPDYPNASFARNVLKKN